MNIYELISRAQGLRQETKLDSVSPDRVGALCEDTLKYINEFQLLASSPSLHKIYASVSAMQADAAPKSDLTGKALKPGQLVVIVPASQSDATAGDVYRYDGPSGNTSAWTFISKIGGVPADAELNATSTNPVQNKAVTEKLTELSEGIGKKADKDGVYPDLTAGDLAGRGESVPAEFGFRASGGKSIKDGRAYIKRIKGNSVVWNQWVDTIAPQDCDLSETDNRLTLTPQGGFPGVKNAISMNIVENHVYICISHRIGGGYLAVNCGGYDGVTNIPFRAKQGHYGFVVYAYEEPQPFSITRPLLIDLTQLFQAGNEPTTIEEFNARVATLGIDMYAYNEGQVIHCNTESIKSVGDNAWDEQWEVGGFTAEGVPVGAANRIRSRNYIEVLANEEYYANEYLTIFFYDYKMKFLSYMDMSSSTFTTPSGCRYIKFYLYGTEDYKHDTLISLYHSGWKAEKDDQYQPYWQDTLPLPIIRKYFPDGMKKWDKIIKKDGKWYAVNATTIARIGDLTCSRFMEGIFSLGNLPKIAAVDSRGFSENVISANFIPSLGAYGNLMETNTVCIVDESLWLSGENLVQYQTAEDLLTSLADVVVYYELAEPIVTEITEDFRDYYNVADFGTEQSQSSVPSAPFSADIIYQFNAVDMIREHELEITELQNVIATMQAQLASLTNS